MAAISGSIVKSFALQLNAAILALSLNTASVASCDTVVNTSTMQSATLSLISRVPLTINGATQGGADLGVPGYSIPTTLNPGRAATLDTQSHLDDIGLEHGQLTNDGSFSVNGIAKSGLIGTEIGSKSFVFNGSPIVKSLVPFGPSLPITAEFFGMTIHELATSDSDIPTGSTPFPSFHVPLLRFWDVAYWAMLEPSKGMFNWTKMDRTIEIAKSNGVEDFVFTFGHVPQWAAKTPSDPCLGGEGAGTCSVPNMQDFDEFATRLVQRYCGTVKFYETWNEPNIKEFWNGDNSDLLQVSARLYQIAKASSNCGCTGQVCKPGGGANPNKVLLPSTASLSKESLGWLASYLSTPGASYQYADIAAFHGYGFSTNPEEIAEQLHSLRKVLADGGMKNVDIWNTEASWGQEKSPVDQNSASWLMRYHAIQAAAGVSRSIWYAYDNCNWGTLWGTSPCGNIQSNENLTPPGIAYGVIEKWLVGAKVTRCIQYQNGLWVCEFERSHGYRAWMLWSSTGSPIVVPTPRKFGIKVFRDWKNNVKALQTLLKVDGMPVLLENQEF